LKYSKFLDKETMFVLETETDKNFKFKCKPVSISKEGMVYLTKSGSDYYGAFRSFVKIISATAFNLKDDHSSDNGECWYSKLTDKGK